MIYKINDTKRVQKLFENWQETLIWSCQQNIMGSIYADSEDNPKSAMAILGDFCFFAGVPCEELILCKPMGCEQEFMIMVPQNGSWEERIESCFADKARKVARYAIKKEKDAFDKKKLQAAVDGLAAGYVLKMIDEELYRICREEGWSRDLVSQYEDYGMYQELGIGVAALKDGKMVAGASAYARYRDGIEIEIDTKEEYRRKGLAYACGAKLILACLERNLYPSWDAQNKGSVALAEKLGYHCDYEYAAYEIWGW